jgi:hypothetical protein
MHQMAPWTMILLLASFVSNLHLVRAIILLNYSFVRRCAWFDTSGTSM